MENIIDDRNDRTMASDDASASRANMVVEGFSALIVIVALIMGAIVIHGI
ncbi:MAG: hypothetical protein K6A90_07660 [Lachnospiraceae bacterium]|nr:hypothetical protein [Lachnospiraceae bacterium]